MKATKLSLSLLALAALLTPVQAQDDVFKQLKTYDSQQRQAVETLQGQIRLAGSDAAKRAAIETGLLTVLNDPATTYAGKQEACRLLYEIGTERSVPTLARMLLEEPVANIARYALERNSAPEAGKALIDALPVAKGGALLGIINSLGNRSEAAAVNALVPFAKGSDKPTADTAVVALGKIGTLSAVQALQSLPDQKLLVQQALVTAADRLASAGNKSDATKLYKTLVAGSTETTVRIAALRGLADTGKDRSQLGALALTALRAPDTRLQVAAATIVSGIPDRSLVSSCVQLWTALPSVVQTPLLAGFTARREVAALPLAEKALESTDELLRITGIRALATLGGAKSVPVLAKRYATSRDDLRNAARTALVELPGAAADQAILQTAQQGEMPVRLALLDIVADRATPNSGRLLQQAAASGEEALSVAALKAAVRAHLALPTGDLIRLFVSTKSDAVRDAAQTAVVAVAKDTQATADALASALPAATPEVKAALLTTLAQIGGDRALALLTLNTQSSDATVKGAAITALADTWSDLRPLPTLLTIARGDSNRSFKIQALRGYFRLLGQDEKLAADDKVAKVKEGIAVAERPDEKRAGLGVLRDCRTAGAIEVAAVALDDAALFDDAADTILTLAAPQKKGNATLAAVQGPATTAALNKVITLAKDDSVKSQAQKLL